MIEILWHGRGGQGAFTAAKLLGAAWCSEEGHAALAFPSFGPERRGAPMRAFTRLSDAPIGDRSALVRADIVVYLDGTLVGPRAADEVEPGGILLVDAAEPPAVTREDIRCVALDADAISEARLGRPIPNTVMLGALSCLIPGLTREAVVSAVRAYMPARLHQSNIELVDDARSLLGAPATAGEGIR